MKQGLYIGALTFLISIFVSLPSQATIKGTTLAAAMGVLLLIILMGVVFDIIGVAVAVASEPPVHAAAAKKRAGAREALWLIRHADKVSSFCNDVVGDIAGTISGAAAAAIVIRLLQSGLAANGVFLNLIVVGLVASLTVGGKAAGKFYAIREANRIVFHVGLIIYWLEKIIRIKVGNGKRGR